MFSFQSKGMDGDHISPLLWRLDIVGSPVKEVLQLQNDMFLSVIGNEMINKMKSVNFLETPKTKLISTTEKMFEYQEQSTYFCKEGKK